MTTSPSSQPDRGGRGPLQYDRERFVEAADGTRLFVGWLDGPGDGRPPAILCDGIGCDGFVWAYLGPHLAQTRDVVHMHYRGHGRSGPPLDRSQLTIRGLARDLLRVIEEVGGEGPSLLLGHSMGTQVALEAHRAAPEKVAAMVLMCGSWGRVTHTFHGHDALSQVLPTVREVVQKHPNLARALWGRVPPKVAFRFAKLSGEVDPAMLRSEDFHRYWQHISDMEPQVFLQLLHAAGDHSAEDHLANVEVPTLVITADSDTFTPPELARAMADRLPGAELFEIRGGSHAAPVEQPLAVQLRLDKFLLEHSL